MQPGSENGPADWRDLGPARRPAPEPQPESKRKVPGGRPPLILQHARAACAEAIGAKRRRGRPPGVHTPWAHGKAASSSAHDTDEQLVPAGEADVSDLGDQQLVPVAPVHEVLPQLGHAEPLAIIPGFFAACLQRVGMFPIDTKFKMIVLKRGQNAANLTHLQDTLGVDRKLLRETITLAAATQIFGEKHVLESFFKTLSQTEGVTIEAKFTMRAYDETPMYLSKKADSKTFQSAPTKVLHSKVSWAMIVRVNGHRILIEGGLKTPLLHMESNSAECHFATLQKGCQLPDSFHACKSVRDYEIINTDSNAAIFKCEQGLKRLDEGRRVISLHNTCKLHRLHTAAGRVTELVKKMISGVVQLTMALNTRHVIVAMRRALAGLIKKRLVFKLGHPGAAATAFRNAALNWVQLAEENRHVSSSTDVFC